MMRGILSAADRYLRLSLGLTLHSRVRIGLGICRPNCSHYAIGETGSIRKVRGLTRDLTLD